MSNTIFTQIASYRDPDLINTLNDLISNADNPQNLKICVNWQHGNEQTLDDFLNESFDIVSIIETQPFSIIELTKNSANIKLIDVPFSDSKGACWARNLIQQYYNDEKYTLQLDSHHRFIKGWDTEIIDIFIKLQSKSKKPLITGYLPSFDPKNDQVSRLQAPWKMNFDRFSPEGIVHFMPSTMDEFKELTEPVPARFYSAHFAFTLGEFSRDVQHDPNLYFHGEEHSISIRAFTHGYDLYHLHKVIAWHYYTRKNEKKQWDDDKGWGARNVAAHLRCRKLLSMGDEVYNPEEFGKYGLGTERTLADYERYSGIRFSDRKVQKYTLETKYAPNPIIEDEEEYNKSFLNYFKHCIDVSYSSVPLDDYNVWAVAFEDENGKELYRLDANKDEIQRMKNDPDGYCKVWRSFYTDKTPYKWIIWPHSESQGWTQRLTGTLYSKKEDVVMGKKEYDMKNVVVDVKYNKPVIEDSNKTTEEKIKTDRIMVHLPAYREPELVPTIKDALKNAKYPERIVFGICRQFNPDDEFDNVDEFRNDPRFKIIDINYKDAKGLAYARALINDTLLEDEEFLLQLDSHHRFTENWDETLLTWYYDLKAEGYNPLICGYLPYYNPFNDPAQRVQEPWFSQAACFYPHGTIFIRPTGIPNWQDLTKPFPARFLSGHFAFGPNKWARDVRHDPNIFFSGEELNLTVRSYTSGYDLFHPHRVIIWHATMREERSGMLIWDDQHKRGDYSWTKQQNTARARIRQLIGVEDNGFDLGPYVLGSVRTIRDYEKYAGINFKKRAFQKWTVDNKFPPNPNNYNTEEEWEQSFTKSFYHLVNIDRKQLPADDYDFILVAFDDKDGKSVNSRFINGSDLQKFLSGRGPIHYEEMFLVEENPSRLVFWGHSAERGWAERVEIKL
jgi:hypothetical protein